MPKYLIKSQISILKHLEDFYDIKKDLLLFDKIGINDLELVLSKLDEHKFHPLVNNVINELTFLIKEGYIIDLKSLVFKNDTVIMDDNDQDLADYTMKLLGKIEEIDKTKIIERDNIYTIYEELNTRLWCSIINNTDETIYCIPGLTNYSTYQLPSRTKDKAYNLVHKMLPIPSDITPWEKIFDLKKDEETIIKLNGLRNWMNELPESIKQNELEDKLNYLNSQYVQSLRRHKIETRLVNVKTIVTTIPKALSELIRLRFDKAIDALFTIAEQNVNFQKLKERSELKGNELAYISHVKSKL